MTVATVLVVLSVWLALAATTVVLVAVAVRRDDGARADLDAELRDLIEQDRQ